MKPYIIFFTLLFLNQNTFAGESWEENSQYVDEPNYYEENATSKVQNEVMDLDFDSPNMKAPSSSGEKLPTDTSTSMLVHRIEQLEKEISSIKLLLQSIN